MKPIIFMFYYVNIDGMSNARSNEYLHNVYSSSKITHDDYDIIQQYFPIKQGDTRVDVITVPNISVIDDSNTATQINKNIQIIKQKFLDNISHQSITDFFEYE